MGNFDIVAMPLETGVEFDKRNRIWIASDSMLQGIIIQILSRSRMFFIIIIIFLHQLAT
jgi:hypothetical protein